jgi:hypothetical protein
MLFLDKINDVNYWRCTLECSKKNSTETPTILLELKNNLSKFGKNYPKNLMFCCFFFIRLFSYRLKFEKSNIKYLWKISKVENNLQNLVIFGNSLLPKSALKFCHLFWTFEIFPKPFNGIFFIYTLLSTTLLIFTQILR